MPNETKDFFEALGEIWRDISALEFLMRCALAQKNGDISKFPLPPYQKGNEYKEYPKSFALYSFGEVLKEFNTAFPQLKVPQELLELRDAMAHGLIAEINNLGVEQLIKFKKQKDKLVIGFSLPLELQRLRQLRQSLHELKGYVMNEAGDKK